MQMIVPNWSYLNKHQLKWQAPYDIASDTTEPTSNNTEKSSKKSKKSSKKSKK